MLLRARLVLPVSRPPLDDGAVRIVGNRIAAVTRWREVSAADRADVCDLGDTILLPGLINAHCHLDYTRMAGLITPPKEFPDWIKAMVALKADWSYSEFAESWLAGAAMLVRHGVTTVADIEAVPELLPEVWTATPLRVVSFRELIHFKEPARAGEFVDAAVKECSALPDSHVRTGLSPHAPYTTTADLLSRAARAARRRLWRLTTHVAESEAEYLMFMYRQGPLFEWLKGQRDLSDCGHGSPVQHLARAEYLDGNVIAVHANYLARGDAELLAERKVSVVHCPRSHEYFRHLRFPAPELARAGVNLCLGTDSLASVVKHATKPLELDLFAEMQTFLSHVSTWSPESVLRLVTLNAARALGRAGELGELSQGALADLVTIPYAGAAEDTTAAVVHHQGPVHASMMDGKWIMVPPP